ncbi:hypothetical protein [Leptospira stimsonii]|uniref:Uncharacterized protein n=1 Tax=Leptospira stimsonii TaxID=2202203 RepID=A0A8B3CHB8_9LEPT|nr:hypothetical protein [Leptospira stimsonii]RHX83230.1 hypothetical protein DLM78_22240 [Leptospira stimsonii]
MKIISNSTMWILIPFLILQSLSCDDKHHIPKGQNELAYFLATYAPQPYDIACQNSSFSIPLSLNSPISITNTLQPNTYRLTTGPSGLKYSFTLSADYPACGVTLQIRNCARPNILASNSIVSCNQGTYSNYVSGGSQICTIPSFANQLVLILIQPNSDQYPNTPCATITFEALI